jgi:acetate kinase
MVHLKGKVDAIVMSAGVGENSPPVRKLLLADLEVGFVRMVLLAVGKCDYNNLAVSVLVAKA